MVLCDAEKAYTGQQDRYLFTALGAGGLEFKSPRPDQSFDHQQLGKTQFCLEVSDVEFGSNKKNAARKKLKFISRFANRSLIRGHRLVVQLDILFELA